MARKDDCTSDPTDPIDMIIKAIAITVEKSHAPHGGTCAFVLMVGVGQVRNKWNGRELHRPRTWTRSILTWPHQEGADQQLALSALCALENNVTICPNDAGPVDFGSLALWSPCSCG